MIIAALFRIGKMWKQMSTGRWLDKEIHIISQGGQHFTRELLPAQRDKPPKNLKSEIISKEQKTETESLSF